MSDQDQQRTEEGPEEEREETLQDLEVGSEHADDVMGGKRGVDDDKT